LTSTLAPRPASPANAAAVASPAGSAAAPAYNAVPASQAAPASADALFAEHANRIHRQTDRLFASLMFWQWIVGIGVAVVVSPRAWAGTDWSVHPHVYAAILLGGLTNLVPAAMACLRPGTLASRLFVSAGQAMTSALLIHLTGGRVETHFHIFGSLALLAFYRDWRALVPATALTAADHVLRGAYLPMSVYGVAVADPWRWLEHAGWVLLIDVFLTVSCVRGVREMRAIAARTAEAAARNAELAATRDTALDCIIVTDDAGRVTEFNPAAERTFGLVRSAAVGRPLADLVALPAAWGTGRAGAPAGLSGVLAAGEASAAGRRTDVEAVRADGTRFPAEIAVSAVRVGGGPPKFVAYLQDITDRRRAEAQAKLAEKLALVADHTDNAVVITDPQGRIEWVNDGFTRVTEYTLPEVVGRKPGSFLQGPDTDPETVAFVRAKLAAGEGFKTEIVNYGKSGRAYWLAIEVQPVRGPDGALRYFMAIETDVTARKQMERELRESRERYELAVRGSNDGMWDWDVPAGTVYYSPQWMAQVGYAEGDWPGDVTTFDALCHPDDKDRVWAAIRATHDGLTDVYSIEFRLKHKDGSWRWILSRAVLVRDAAGKPLRMAGCHTDLTDKRRADEALRQAEEKYRGIFEHAVMGIFQTSRAGGYLSVNPALARIYGYDSVEDLRASVTNIRRQLYVDPGRRPEFVRLMAEHGQVADFESEIFRKDGSKIWISENARAVRGPDGVLDYYEGTIQDITQRKLAEAALVGAKDQAEQACRDAERAKAQAETLQAQAEEHSRAKSQFLANMSHEIRTPLNGVIGMAELLLRRGGLTDQQQRYTQVIKSSADTLLSLINDVLDFSKIEAGKLELSCVDFDLRDGVEQVGEMLAPKAAAKGLEFACHVHPRVAQVVHGDLDRVRQILINLANNALKFTERGEVLIRVAPEPAAGDAAAGTAAAGTAAAGGDAGGLLRFSVSDTGVGIPPDRLDRLFKSFSQVDASTTRKYGGTGLGLAIAKQLVELMGGAIGVQSTPGAGSTFWFTARFTAPKGAPADAVGHAPRPGAASLRGMRALAVDDHATAREVLHDQLNTWGFEVDLAEDGEDALRRLRAAAAAGRPYRVAVVDLLMPKLDGRGLAVAAKADPALADTPLVMLTSMDNPFDDAEMRRAGFAACLTKPIRQSQLFDAVVAAVTGPELARRRAEAAGRPGGLLAEPAGTESAAAGPLLAGVTVLLAEDNEVNQEVARELLVDAGCTVEVVGNGRLAVEATARRFDVVLMDCQMPEMDGFEAARRIRDRERQAGGGDRQPVIALTANAVEGDRQRCLDAGMDGYVTKPVDPERLVAAIRALVPVGGNATATHAVEPSATQLKRRDREGAEQSNGAAPTNGGTPSTSGPAGRPLEPTRPTPPLPDGHGSLNAASGALAPVVPQAGDLLPIDPTSLLRRCQGKTSLAERLLAKFEVQLTEQIRQLQDSLARHDQEVLTRIAHTIKGSAANLSAEPLRAVAGELERLGQAAAYDAAAGCLDRLAAEAGRCAAYVPTAVAAMAPAGQAG
jgi:PAS domain S-box-containing protein